MSLAGTWSFDAIGTRWQIDTVAPLGTGVRAEVDALIDRFDREWSRFRSDSLVTALAAGGDVDAPADAADMLGAYVALSEATSGAVNPLVGASLAQRGYDADYSFVDRGALPAPERWQDLLTWTDATLRLAAPGVIDIGALGKGRLVDLVADVVAERVGVPLVVDASGDIAVRGGAERIALEHPFDPSKAIGVWEVSDGALCASAVNRRVWGMGAGLGDALGSGGLHHVLDARTGEPVRTYAATWAVAPTAMIADALATALFFDGGPELAARWNAQWVRISTDGRVEWSDGCRADLFVRR